MFTIDSKQYLRRLFILLNPDVKEGESPHQDEEDEDSEEEVEDEDIFTIQLENNTNLEQLYMSQNVYGPTLIMLNLPKLKFCGCLGWINRRLVIDNTRFFVTFTHGFLYSFTLISLYYVIVTIVLLITDYTNILLVN